MLSQAGDQSYPNRRMQCPNKNINMLWAKEKETATKKEKKEKILFKVLTYQLQKMLFCMTVERVSVFTNNYCVCELFLMRLEKWV